MVITLLVGLSVATQTFGAQQKVVPPSRPIISQPARLQSPPRKEVPVKPIQSPAQGKRNSSLSFGEELVEGADKNPYNSMLSTASRGGSKRKIFYKIRDNLRQEMIEEARKMCLEQ